MAISTCSRCGKADAETDSRKWYITELTQYKEKYLGPAFGGIPPGTLTLKAWKFKQCEMKENKKKIAA